MKLGLGIITSGGYEYRVPSQFVWSLYELHSAILKGETPVTANVLIRSGKFPTDAARNEICRAAITDGCDRLLFLDADHQFSVEAIVRLLDSPHDIVTARYHVKKPPYHPNLYLIPKTPHKAGHFRTVHYGQGVFPVDRCGAGALSIKRHVLEKIGDPWFRYQRDPDPPHDLSVSEDFYFCQRAQEEGFEIMADWDAEVGHILTGVVTGEWYTQYLETMERGIAKGQPELVDQLVACGYPNGYELPSGHTVPPYGLVHESDH